MLRYCFIKLNKLANTSNISKAIKRCQTNLSNQVADPIQEQTKNNEKSENTNNQSKPQEKITFAKLFRESKFVALGDLENKYLIGKIVDVVGDDLYVDYGGKFNCVVKRPFKNSGLYVRNANVKIKLISFEMASYFLNAAKHITLLESDAELVGLYKKEENLEKDERTELFKKEVDELNSEPYY